MRMRLRSTYQNRISENHFSGKYIRFKGGGGGYIYKKNNNNYLDNSLI